MPTISLERAGPMPNLTDMIGDRTVRIYYDDALLARAAAGEHNYTNRLTSAFAMQGYDTRLERDSAAARYASAEFPGYALFHMEPPSHPRALTTRLAYFYPFWRIEQSARRWDWQIAHAAFDAEAIDPVAAASFWRRRRKTHFGEGPDRAKRGEFVYIALQGRLLDQRSFQTMSPLEMVRETLGHSGNLPVLAGLHPKEVYSQAERAALADLVALNPRLRVVTTPAETLLRDCAYVVTQNSSVALSGYFFEKPAVLFGQIDFHHIAHNVASIGVSEAFRRVEAEPPDFRRYMYWFLKQTAINAGSPEAESQILAQVRRHGWAMV